MITNLGALKIRDPKRWVREVARAMRAAKGRVDVAAPALGVSRRTLFRWLALPDLRDVMRAPVGVHLEGGGEE